MRFPSRLGAFIRGCLGHGRQRPTVQRCFGSDGNEGFTGGLKGAAELGTAGAAIVGAYIKLKTFMQGDGAAAPGSAAENALMRAKLEQLEREIKQGKPRLSWRLLKAACIFGAGYSTGKLASDFQSFDEMWEDSSGDPGKVLHAMLVKRCEQKSGRGLVQISPSVFQVRQAAAGHGGWNADMKEYCGKRGVAVRMDDDKHTVRVRFGDERTWVFNQGVVYNIAMKGDIVSVSGDVDLVRRTAPSHGGWNSQMERFCGMQGVVRGCVVDDLQDEGTVLVGFGSSEDTFAFSADVLVKAS